MYCPKVLIGPFGPAPYLMILNPPVASHFRIMSMRKGEVGTPTIYETHYQPHG
jgi:hypothetical protein